MYLLKNAHLGDGRVVDQLPLLPPLGLDLDVGYEDEEAGGHHQTDRPDHEERQLEAPDAVQKRSQCWTCSAKKNI